MRLAQVTLFTAAAGLCACSPAEPGHNAAGNGTSAAPAQPHQSGAVAPGAAPQPAQTPQARSPVEPPPAPASATQAPPPADKTSATGPKSTDAALDLARQFAGLVSARKFDQAYALLQAASGFASAADLKRHFAPYSDLDLTVIDSPPPEPEGAAGSIYLTVQAELSGMVGGRRVHHPATITLRRVNDVPGSSEAQRRWHIEAFDDSVT